ncbi:hypothetical protein AB0L06_15990 [Spirillospora sp. NPDC052269]
MKHIRLTGAASVVAAMSLGLASLASVATAPAASATVADCADWPWPSSLPHGSVEQQRTLPGGDGKSIKLVVGTINGRQAGWAVIGGITTSDDLFWLDVSDDGGKSNMQCGPFWSGGPSQRWWTPANYSSSQASHVFRACGRVKGVGFDVCTSWW